MLYNKKPKFLFRYINKMKVLNNFTPESGLDYIKQNSNLLNSYPEITYLDNFNLKKDNIYDKDINFHSSCNKSKAGSDDFFNMTYSPNSIIISNYDNLLRKKRYYQSDSSEDSKLVSLNDKLKFHSINKIKKSNFCIK